MPSLPLWVLRSGWAILISGLLLRWWLRDLFALWAPLFYALAPGVLVMAFLLVALLEKRPGWRAAALVLGSTVWAWPTTSSEGIRYPEALRSSNKNWSLLFWNLARPSGLHAGALKLVKQRRPDLAAFVEPGDFSQDLLQAYRHALPDYFVEWMPRGILWMSRALSRRGQRDRLAAQGAWAMFRVEDDAGAFPVLVCDVRIEDGWCGHRAEQFAELQRLLPQHDSFIVMGDFNTPMDSRFFDLWMPRGFYALHPKGLPVATWPALLPLWSLDQVWLGKRWRVDQVERLWLSSHSDHAALWLQIHR